MNFILFRGECRKKYSKDGITDQMICAGQPGGGKDACQV